MEWLKLHNDIIHDPKIRALAYEDRWHFVALMVLMNDGTLEEPDSIRDELVEISLGIHGVDLENLKKRLIRLRLIGEDWKPTNWNRRQHSEDPTNAIRQAKYRKSLKLRKGKDSVTDSVTPSITAPYRIEEEEEEEEELILKKNEPYLPLAESMWEAIEPITKCPDVNLGDWANTLRLMVERDKRNLEDIERVFRWANQDDFWRVNILSAGSLRKQFPRLYAKANQTSTGGWRRALA